MAVQPDQLQKWLVQNAFHGLGGMTACKGEAELLVVDTGRHRGVAVDVDVWCHPDQHALRPADFASQVGDFHQRVDDHPADARSLLGHPARDGRRQQCLGGIDGFDVAQSGAVPGQPVPKVGLVENVCRGAELVGDVRQWHISDA